jgi:metal-sulfur cluster biosynthetic enzyme
MPSFFQRISSLWKKPKAPVPISAPAGSPMPPSASVPQPTVAVDPHSGVSPVTNSEDPPVPIDEELVYQALRKCYDPEIPVNIVDLGLIYDVRIAEGRVEVKMTLTTQGCGMGGYIASEAEGQLRSLQGVQEASVQLVWDPPWNPNMISPAGRKILGLPE